MRAPAGVRLRDATPADGAALASIYNYYIDETTVTFEETRVSGLDIAARIKDVQGLDLPWLVAQD